MKYLVGIDIGTSGTKSIVADETGKVVASCTKTYPLYTPRPGWAEQNPSDWFDACVRGLNAILPKVDKSDIVGVSFSGQMHGLVMLDKDNNVLIRKGYLFGYKSTIKISDILKVAKSKITIVNGEKSSIKTIRVLN